jgi:hypothetical protein
MFLRGFEGTGSGKCLLIVSLDCAISLMSFIVMDHAILLHVTCDGLML